MMLDINTTLVTIWAHSMAAWIPVRDFKCNLSINTYLARRDYSLGIQWFAGGGSDLERRRSSRFLSGLCRRGLVEIYKPRTKTKLIKLTAEGENTACQLAGLGWLHGAWVSLCELLKYGPAGSWISERHLFGVSPPGETIGQTAAVVESTLLFSLSRGCAESGGDVRRNVSYRLTDLGQAFIDGPEPGPDAGLKYMLPELAQFYENELQNALHKLATDPLTELREIGILPLPCSMGVPIR